MHLFCRLKWREGGSLTMLTNTACDLLDTIACITPPHVQKQQSASPAGVQQVTSTPATYPLMHLLAGLLPEYRC